MLTQVMLITQVDVIGRETPVTGEAEALGLTDGDLDFIFEMWANDRPAPIGEFEYRKPTAAEREAYRAGGQGMDPQEIRDEIETLLNANPETGEQWAEICRLEALAAELEKAAIPGVARVADDMCAKLFWEGRA
ncbi:MAG: hypothetical protein KIT32_12100 [Rhodocyclaceae bacterium]|nr:hypothetical protein [Rhodocyclaceae bacterium]